MAAIEIPVIEEVFFLPPMAVARLGGSDTPLDSFTWVEDPSQHGAGTTVIQPAISLEVQVDGSVRPFLPVAIQFRDGNLLRPVAPFFELWATLQGQADPVPLTAALLRSSGGSGDGVTYTVTAANRKASRRADDDSCAFTAQVQVIGSDHNHHALLASSLGPQGLVSQDQPIPLGQFQAIRPTVATSMGVDLDQLRVRFTPATGQVYGPPSATSDIDPDTNRQHQMVPPGNRILNASSPWLQYDAGTTFNSPEPSDTYDGADRGDSRSFGVVDDTCDAVIEAVVVVAGARLRASARVFTAPPDFAPDRRPFVSLADELKDREPPAVEPQEDVADSMKRLADLFQRVFETVSLANVDAMRLRSIGGGQDGGTANDTPRTDDSSMTPPDQPYYRTDQEDIPAPEANARVPFHDTAVEMHAPLADADDLALFLRTKSLHVKQLVRPPYGAFKDLTENPAATAASDPLRRDPRITRDTLHDMRMPPYMRDSDATALSLTRRQYNFLMQMVDALQVAPGAAPGSQPLPTVTNAHVEKVLARRKNKKRKP
jgi:hypothetical protein